MPSPFSVFRQYQKALIAFFGVLLMLSFLIADPLSMMTGSGSGPSAGRRSDAPVTFKDGSLSDEQLLRMHRSDMLADEYVDRVKAEAQKASKDAQIGMFPYVDDPRFGASRSERRLVKHYLLAKKAHAMGLSMSNEDIDAMLIRLADDVIDRAELKKIRQKLLAEDINSTIIITEKDLYAQLRINFLSQEVMAMVRNSAQPLQFEQMGFPSPSSVTLPPAKAWEMFRRTARQAKVELLPLEVEKFVDDVKASPSLKEKNELFEKYKDFFPAPFSPDPGFATPHRIAFGYVRIDFQPFLDQAKEEVTEEAIRADYDERAKNGELTVPLEKKEEKPEGTKPEDAKPEDSEPEEKQPDDKKPEEKPDPESKDAKGEEEKQPEDVDEQEELADDDGQEPEAKEEPGEEKPAADEEKKPEGETEAKPDEDNKPDEEKKPDDKKPAEEKVETRTKTYEEMEDIIRGQLAQKPAQDAQRDAIKELFDALNEYHTKFREWEIEKEAAASAKVKEKVELAPQPELLPMIGAVLKKYGFKYQQTALVDAFEVEDEEIGKASVGFPNQQQIPLADVFMYDLKLYQPFPASEGFLRDTQYLLWKEADQPQRSAVRKEVEEQLVHAVKLQEAFKLAKAEAEQLAAKAREQADQSLRISVGPVDKAAAVVEPLAFSWYTSGFAPGGMGMRLQETEVPEVPYPGDEFMQTVLDLQPGEIGVAADQPHKRVYVIRLVSQTPKEEILRQMFMARGIADRNVSQQYNIERLRTLDAWLDNVVNKEWEIKWNRTPQQFGSF